MERIQEQMYRARQERARLQAQSTMAASTGDAHESRQHATGKGVRSDRLPWAVAGLVLGAVVAAFALQSKLFRQGSVPSQLTTRLELPATSPAGGADRPAASRDNRARIARLEREVLELSTTVTGLRTSLRDVQDWIDSNGQPVQAAVTPLANGTPEVVSAINTLPPPSSGGTPVRSTPASDRTSPAGTSGVEPAQAGWVIILASLPSRESAERMVSKVRKRDIPASHYRVNVKGKTYWRVQATGFESAARARSDIPQIEKSLGLKGVWVTQRTE